jgi:hypothetical protein
LKRIAALMLVVCWGCGAQPHSQQDDPRTAAPAPAASASADASHGGAMAHGDHQPRYGGVVLMNGDLHFEVVAGSDGTYRVYFSDELRRELPASTVSEVVLTITRENTKPETLILNVDESGESWIAAGRPIIGPQATIRVAYFYGQKPYWIDIPWTPSVPVSQRAAA